VVGRRALLLAGAALPVSAYAQCVTDSHAVDSCRGGIRNGVAVPAPASSLDFMTPGTLPPGVTFTRTSVGTYFDSAGTLQTATANTPRWDYDPVTLALRGLLIEEQRTNLLLNSATLGTQTVTVTAVAYTLSFYGTGSITLSGVSTAGPLTGTGAFPRRVSLNFTPTAGSLTLTVTGTVQNAQLEAGGFCTSYVATVGTAATRTVESATMPLGGWFDPNVGTLAADVFLPQVPTANVNIEFLFIDSGSPTDCMGLRQAGTLGFGQITYWLAGALVFGQALPGVLNATAVNKLALTYSRGPPIAASGVLNAGGVITGVPTGLPTCTRMNFGNGRNNSINGHIRRVRYWNTALSGAALQVVTT